MPLVARPRTRSVALVLAVVTIATLWAMEPLKRVGHLDSKAQAAADKRHRGKRGG